MLSDDQIARFETDGILVVPDVVPARLLNDIRREYDGLLDGLYRDWFVQGRVTVPPEGLSFWDKLQIAYDARCDWFQPMDISLPGDEIMADTPMHFGPAVFDLVTCPRVLDCVEALIGPEITSNPIQHVRIKPPAEKLSGSEVRAHITKTDWHQDRGVALAEADDTAMVTVWVAMTDATEANGCLTAVPKSPSGMLPHCPKTQTAIADGFVDETAARALPVPAGGIVILHPLTPHASLANTTDGFRWSFDLRYNVTGQPSGRSHFPEFIARSAADPTRELNDWRRWKSMWEEARAHLSARSHIPIHRWDSDAPYCA